MKRARLKLDTASMLKEIYAQFNNGENKVPGVLEALNMWRIAFVRLAQIAARVDDPEMFEVLEQIGIVHRVPQEGE